MIPPAPKGMTLVGYHPKPGRPVGPDGRLLLDFQFAPIKREAKVAEPEQRGRQGLLV